MSRNFPNDLSIAIMKNQLRTSICSDSDHGTESAIFVEQIERY